MSIIIFAPLNFASCNTYIPIPTPPVPCTVTFHQD
jgi:hypothetical protein